MTTKPDITPENVARMLALLTPEHAPGMSTLQWLQAADEAERRFDRWSREAVPALAARVAEVEAERDALLPLLLVPAADRNPRAEAAEAKLAASEALVERLRGAATDLRDIIRGNIVQKPGPATVETPDGKVHTGPLAEYMHDLLPMIADVLDRAVLEETKT